MHTHLSVAHLNILAVMRSTRLVACHEDACHRRRTSAAGSHAVLTDEEDALLDGDALWQDDRPDVPRREGSPGRRAGAVPVTNSALKLTKCLHAYGQLMR